MPPVSDLTLEEKVGQIFVIRPDSIDPQYSTQKKMSKRPSIGTRQVNQKIKAAYSKYPAGGFVIFARNIESPEQIKQFNEDLHELGTVRPLIFVDEEGGIVARLANHPEFDLPKVENMAVIGNTKNENLAYETGRTIGEYLQEYNFDVDFAPIADVNTNPKNIVIGKRAFSSDPLVAGKMDVAFLEGLSENKITGCLKHFPGHGDTTTDTHAGYAETIKTWEELLDCEMISFKMGIENDAKMIMTAHISAPNVTGHKLPSTLSYTILTKKLREELGFNGIIITDAMEMGAINKIYKSDEAAIRAFLAGADIILMPYDYKTAYKGFLKAVKSGRISEDRLNQSVERILKLKSFYSDCE